MTTGTHGTFKNLNEAAVRMGCSNAASWDVFVTVAATTNFDGKRRTEGSMRQGRGGGISSLRQKLPKATSGEFEHY